MSKIIGKRDTDVEASRGVNIDLTRAYGRSIGKQRVVDRVPLATPKRRSIVGAIRLDGTIRYRSWQVSINRQRFLEYLKTTLVPALRPGDIVVMDNLRCHKKPPPRRRWQLSHLPIAMDGLPALATANDIETALSDIALEPAFEKRLINHNH